MIINNKNIKGIYEYQPSLEFEPGDFVVDGGILYKVLQRSRNLIPSLSPENFEVYVGGNCIEPSEYKVGKIKKDCILSAISLDSILSSYMSGFSESGLITNRITSDLRIISSSLAGSNSVSRYTSPLDTILSESSLNNAIFYVDPNSEVENIIPAVEGETGVRYILRQYTYVDTDNESIGEPSTVRIQELTKLSSKNVVTLYRYVLGNDNEFSVSDSTSWVDTSLNSDTQKELSKLRNYYISEIEKYKKLQLVLSNNFRFKKLSIPDNSSRLVLSYGRSGDLVVSDLTTNDVPITFTISTLDSLGFLRVYDITIELSVLIKAKTAVTYKVGCSDISLDVDFPDSNSISFSLNSEAIFQSCYYQQLVSDLDTNVLLSRESSSLLIKPSMVGVNSLSSCNVPIQINTKTIKGNSSRDEIVVVRLSDVVKNIESSTTKTYTIRLSPDSDLGCNVSFVLVDGNINLTISPSKSGSDLVSNLVEVKKYG